MVRRASVYVLIILTVALAGMAMANAYQGEVKSWEEKWESVSAYAAELNDHAAGLEARYEELKAERDALMGKLAALEEQVQQLKEELTRREAEAAAPPPAAPPPAAAPKPSPAPTPKPTRIAYLTFDDGPSATTEPILDILKAHGVPATFFVVGNDTAFGRAMYRRMVNEGHAIGNHTYSHDYSKIYRSPEAFMADVQRLDKLLMDVVGIQTRLFRFPGGSNNTVSRTVAGYDVVSQIMPVLEGAGYYHSDWNVSAGDSSATPQTAEQITSRVLNHSAKMKVDIIVLFHDLPRNHSTVEALPQIIQGLKAQGYGFAVLEPGGYTVRFPR